MPEIRGIAPRRTGPLVPLKAAPCRSQALYLFVKLVIFPIEARHLRFWHIGAAQLIECLTDGEFSYLSHTVRFLTPSAPLPHASAAAHPASADDEAREMLAQPVEQSAARHAGLLCQCVERIAAERTPQVMRRDRCIRAGPDP